MLKGDDKSHHSLFMLARENERDYGLKQNGFKEEKLSRLIVSLSIAMNFNNYKRSKRSNRDGS